MGCSGQAMKPMFGARLERFILLSPGKRILASGARLEGFSGGCGQATRLTSGAMLERFILLWPDEETD